MCATANGWALVDIEGDGRSDGYVAAAMLEAVWSLTGKARKKPGPESLPGRAWRLRENPTYQTGLLMGTIYVWACWS